MKRGSAPTQGAEAAGTRNRNMVSPELRAWLDEVIIPILNSEIFGKRSGEEKNALHVIAELHGGLNQVETVPQRQVRDVLVGGSNP